MNMIFMGRKKYGAEMLRWSVEAGIKVLAVCSDVQEVGNPVLQMARQLAVPCVTMEEAEAISTVTPLDLVVSYLYSRKIRKPLIDNPSLGCINFHPAILPEWRGTAGYNIAILNKLSEWGATAHYVNENIDTGAVIRSYRFSFDYRHETAVTLERKTQQIQMDLYKSVIADVLEYGRLECVCQKKSQGKYISRQEMNALKKVDVKKDDIDLKVRAFWFPPYDGAYIELHGKKYTLVNEHILKLIASEMK